MIKKLDPVFIMDNVSEGPEIKALNGPENKAHEYSQILANIVDAVFCVDLSNAISYHNPAASDISGYSGAEIEKLKIDELFIFLDRDFKAALKSGFKTFIRPNQKNICLLQKKDGRTKLVECAINQLLDQFGEATGAVLTVKDLSPVPVGEVNGKELSSLFSALQHSMDAILLTDTNGTITYVNPQFEKIYGYSKDDVLGQNPRILKSGKQSSEFYKKVWDAILSGKSVNGEIVNRTAAGEFITIEENITAIHDPDGAVRGYISVHRDITEKKTSEEVLKKALDKAEESDRLKTAFLNQMSHEVRTPLNSILGFVSLLQDELATRGQKDLLVFFDSIHRSSMRLQRTIEDILAMSSVQTGTLYTSEAEINLEKILKLIVKDFSSLAEEKKLELNFINESVNSTLKADSYTIVQAFQHLIDNALKFTNKGKVDVCIYDKNGEVCVDIIDTGIGISESYMCELFKPFSQEEVGYNRVYDGNGLGLALTNEYLKLNNADIRVESIKGKGSKFTVIFPKSK